MILALLTFGMKVFAPVGPLSPARLAIDNICTFNPPSLKGELYKVVSILSQKQNSDPRCHSLLMRCINSVNPSEFKSSADIPFFMILYSLKAQQIIYSKFDKIPQQFWRALIKDNTLKSFDGDSYVFAMILIGVGYPENRKYSDGELKWHIIKYSRTVKDFLTFMAVISILKKNGHFKCNKKREMLYEQGIKTENKELILDAIYPIRCCFLG